MDDIQLRAKRNNYFNSILFISLIMYIHKLYKLSMTTALFPPLYINVIFCIKNAALKSRFVGMHSFNVYFLAKYDEKL